jgi:RNA polymerase sigma-70 factor (ECF subfamily)
MDSQFERLQALFQKSREGNREAYAEFLNELYPLVRQKIRMTLGDFLDSDDVTQECLIGIHQSLATYDRNKPIKPWINGVIRHKVADYFRVLARRRESDYHETDFPVTNPESSTNLEAGEAARGALGLALQNLPEDQKRALELTKIVGLSCRAAALREGIQEAAFRKRVSRAYDNIRKQVEKDLGEG